MSLKLDQAALKIEQEEEEEEEKAWEEENLGGREERRRRHLKAHFPRQGQKGRNK